VSVVEIQARESTINSMCLASCGVASGRELKRAFRLTTPGEMGVRVWKH